MYKGYLIITLVFSLEVSSQTSLPLFQISDMTYAGAFRLPAATYGESDLNYSEGPIAYNPINNSLFIVGHSHHQALAEFTIPDLLDSSLNQLNSGVNLQPFVTLLIKPGLCIRHYIPSQNYGKDGHIIDF